MTKAFAILAACLVLLTGAACTVHQADSAPPLTGPSGLGQTVTITATPDSITRDGQSQSAVVVRVIDPNGQPAAGVALRMDMFVGGSLVDFGTLSARTIATGSDGRATTVYTAPPALPTSSPLSNTGLVTIAATPINGNAQLSLAFTTDIRLMPQGVILPPAANPTAAFTVSPTPVNFNIAAIFDASTSCGGTVTGGVCSSGNAITLYSWKFGDGASASGKTVSHTFTSATQASTTFNVELTVTNDRGVSASSTQQVSVAASPIPSGDFVFSPTTPQVNQVVLFNADAVRAAPGHSLVQFSWIFGDGASAGGFLASHAFSAVGTYNVTLTVADEVGQKLTISHPVNVGSGQTGTPFANFTFSPPSPVTVGTTVTFDGSASTAPNGATITSYQWDFSDLGSTGSVNTSSPTVPHTYTVPGTYTVSLVVIDSQGRSSAAATRPIQVQ